MSGRNPRENREPPQEEASSSSRNEISDRKLSLRRYADATKNSAKEAKEETIHSDSTGDGCYITLEAFHQILKERKAEFRREVQEKLMEGRKRIVDMKSRFGINPLELFPKEIWDKILGELCPADRASMREVHILFRDLTESNLIRDILLPLVMDKVCDLNRHPPIRPYFYPPEEEVFPSDPMEFRLVSRSLRNTIDLWIENFILDSMRDVNRTVLQNPYFQVPRFYLSGSQKWVEQVLSACRGPIISRPQRFFQKSLQAHFTLPSLPRRPPLSDEEKQALLKRCTDQFVDNVTEFLKLVGQQILFFRVSLSYMKELDKYGFTIQRIYQIIQEWLLLMPNVKWLQLSATGLTSLMQKEDWIAEARRGLELYPMPTLGQLERVDLTVESWSRNRCQVHMIWDAILLANPHVKYQTYNGDLAHYERLTDPAVLPLALETAVCGKRKAMWDLPQLQRIGGNNWNLKIMTLLINCINENEMNSIFRTLQSFPTLEDLTLGLNNIKFGDGNIMFLKLPNLKKLKIGVGPVIKFAGENGKFMGLFSIQFLLHCVKLQSLTWHNFLPDSGKLRREMEMQDDDINVVIDFQGGLVDLEGSNIWDVFPKLRGVQVKYREGSNDEGRSFFSREYQNRKLVHESNDKWSVNSL